MAKIKAGSMIARVKQSIANAGQARKGVFYVKTDQKRRIRFLDDFEEGKPVVWHSKWVNNKAEIDSPCLKLWGKECPFCGTSEVRTREKYVWQVWDYDAKEIRLFCYAANNFSPIPQLVELAEAYGTLLSRDYQIGRRGEGSSTSYGVVALDPAKFRIDVRKLSEKKLLALLAEAFVTGDLDDYPDADEEEEEYDDDDDEDDEELDEDEEDDSDEDDDDDEDEEEEEEPPRKRKPVKAKPKAKASVKKKSRR